MNKKKKSKPKNLRIRGIVTESRSSKPLAGLTVRVFDEADQREGEHLGEAATADDGKFVIRFGTSRAAKTARAAFPNKGPDLVFHVFESDGTPLRITDPYCGDARFKSLTIKIRLSERDRLNKMFGVLLEQALKQEDVLELASKMLARKYELDAGHVYKTLVDSDPFGIDPFTWRTTVCCILNNIMDAFKESPLGSQLLFNGGTYKHLWTMPNIRGFVRGPVLQGSLVHEGVEGREDIDEDFNFKIEPTQATLNNLFFRVTQSGQVDLSELADLFDPTSEYFNRLHCEIIPCDQTGDMRRFMAQLRMRARQAEADWAARRTPAAIQVELAGELTWDGRHGPWPGHLEIHPVTWARIV